MKNIFKKMVTLGLVTTMIISGSVVAFAGSRSGSASIGDEGGGMDFTVSCNGQYASAGMYTTETSDSCLDGRAYYNPERDYRYLYAAVEQSVGCSTSVYQIYSQFYYAEATFSASLNSGGYNSVFLNCN